eukprot:12146726-Ditylum_brightwellii.AAC.1
MTGVARNNNVFSNSANNHNYHPKPLSPIAQSVATSANTNNALTEIITNRAFDVLKSSQQHEDNGQGDDMFSSTIARMRGRRNSPNQLPSSTEMPGLASESGDSGGS